MKTAAINKRIVSGDELIYFTENATLNLNRCCNLARASKNIVLNLIVGITSGTLPIQAYCRAAIRHGDITVRATGNKHSRNGSKMKHLITT